MALKTAPEEGNMRQLTAAELAELTPEEFEREKRRSAERAPYLSRSELSAEILRWREAGRILLRRADELAEMENYRLG